MAEVFAPYDAVVTPSGSCCSVVREKYAGLFDAGSSDRAAVDALAAKTFELVEFLETKLKVDPATLRGKAPSAAPLTCHDACHLRGIHRVVGREDLRHPSRKRRGVGGQAVREHRLPAAGLRGRELRPHPDMLEHQHRRLQRARRKRFGKAGGEEGDAHGSPNVAGGMQMSRIAPAAAPSGVSTAPSCSGRS